MYRSSITALTGQKFTTALTVQKITHWCLSAANSLSNGTRFHLHLNVAAEEVPETIQESG